MHALLVDHYIQGAYYPRGGSSEIAFHTIPLIQRAGGAVLTSATVQGVLQDSAGRACGKTLNSRAVVSYPFNRSTREAEAGGSL